MLLDARAALDRGLEKDDLVIKWMQSEVWSTPSVIASLLGIDKRPVYKVLGRLRKRGILNERPLRNPVGNDVKLWGISQQHCINGKYFRRAISIASYKHIVDRQLLRVQLESAGASDWVSEHWFDRLESWPVYPDALFSMDGYRIALEVEVSIKQSSLYEGVFRRHIANIDSGRYDAVYYYCPSNRHQVRSSKIESLFRKSLGKLLLLREDAGELFSFADY